MSISGRELRGVIALLLIYGAVGAHVGYLLVAIIRRTGDTNGFSRTSSFYILLAIVFLGPFLLGIPLNFLGAKIGPPSGPPIIKDQSSELPAPDFHRTRTRNFPGP
jgi:hypothetical protein